MRRKPGSSTVTFGQEARGPHSEQVKMTLTERSSQKARTTRKNKDRRSELAAAKTDEAWPWTGKLPDTMAHTAE